MSGKANTQPPEVIHERLEDLWANCENHHHRRPLEAKAREHGYTFRGQFGESRRGRTPKEPAL